MAKLENGESITRYESRLRHADGSYRWFDWKVVPEDGLYYAVGRDITEERARAAELETSNRELQRQIEERERVEGAMREMQRLEAVGQLTAGVAHDFNNLLQIITGTVSLLDRDVPADSAQGRRLQNIKLAAQRGSKLTSQLLAFARRQNLVPQDIDIRATLEGMEELLRTTMGPDVSVSLSLPESAVLRADPTQLELVLINLAINARDAMNGKGQLTVTVGTEEIDAPLSPSDAPRGRYIAIAVSDTGTGMAPDVAERAFEPFFTTKPVGRGSGLGLSQVVGFAKQSGGGVRLRTAPGQGTTVTVLLPASASASPHEDAVPSPKPETAARATKQTILVVDDEHLVREVMTEHLRGQGYTVHDAATPGAALDLLAVGVACDAAVVDFSMPGMNGQELAAHIRKRLPDLPVLFVTGYAGAREFSAMPRSALLEKPFTDAQLIAKLDALLRADSA
ncbi:MAG: response regulator [Alphaproteobacteria bacterium]|nr:response regulator [Alphaproteobacteria bacterium]